MFGQIAIIEICKDADVNIGDAIVFAEKVVVVHTRNENNFIGNDGEYVPRHFSSYYKVHQVGDRLKINSWRERLK